MIDRSELESLVCETGAIAGSKTTIWVMKARHVASVPTSCKGEEVSEPVQILSGTASVPYHFPHDTLSFQEPQKYGPGGEYFELILEGYRDKISPHHQHEICKLAPGYYIVIYQDANGYVRLIGTPDKPLRFTSFADTGKSGQDQNGVLWRFYGVSKCPSIFMDPSIEPPNELLIPFARLNLFEDSVNGDCFYKLSASGSRLGNGTNITSTTPIGTAVLNYYFYYGSTLLYHATIGADEDATNILNWNYQSGTRSAAEFEAEIVDNIVFGGIGFLFSLDLHYLSILDSPNTLRVQLVIDDWEEVSLPAQISVSLCSLQPAYYMTTTLQINFLIQVIHSSVQNVYVDWGDGSVGVYRNLTALSYHTFYHDYALPGSNDVKVYMNQLADLTYLYVAIDQLTALDASSLSGMKTLHARSNQIENDQILHNLTSLEYINIRSNEFIQAIYLPPSGQLISFIAYQCDMLNPLDFTPFASTLEWVEIYSNNNLQFCDVTGCILLTDYLSRNCDLLNDQDLTSCTALERVEIQNNSSLAFVDVSGLENLYKYHAYFCDITNDQDLSAAGSSLEDVLLNGNEIELIILGNHPNLVTLYAHENDLSGVYNLNTCVSLISLDLSGNNISDVVMDQCTVSEHISLDNNNIDSTELNRILDDIYAFRSVSPAAHKTLKLNSNLGTLNSTSWDKINGTGAYLGDGLVDHNWVVTAT